MNDPRIVDLDVEETASAAPWRAGSLTLLAAPLVVLVLVAALVVPRFESRPVSGPVPTSEPARATLLFLTAFPAPTNPPTPTAAPIVLADPDVFADRSWSALGPAHAARGDVAEAVLEGTLYVIGGTGSSEDGTHVFRYDPRTGVRQRAPDLPVSLDHAMAATLGGRIYVMGGYVFGQPSARVFSLAANDASWTVESLLPQGRAAGGAIVMNGHIWLVGGVTLNGSRIADPWSWDGKGRWTTGLAPMPTPRDHLALGTYRGSICAAGGNGGERAFECYEPVRNEWATMPDLRRPVIAGRAAAAAGWFWVISVDVQVFTIDWHVGPRLVSPRAGAAVAAIDDVLYVVEGATGRAQPMEMLRTRP